MRDFGKVHTSVWASDTLKHLDADAKLLALYLLTSPHSNALGAFRLPDAYACDDLAWTKERLLNGLGTLSNVGFAVRDEATSWVWIKKWHEWNEPDNPNMRKGVVKLIDFIPSAVPFRDQVAAAWGCNAPSNHLYANGYETVSKPTSQSQSQSLSLDLKDQEQDDPSERVPFEKIRAAYNDALPMLPSCRKITGERKTHVRARWNEDPDHQSVDYWVEFFEYVAASDFLTGRNGVWNNCTFDWLMNDGNHVKVTEGKYENKAAV